MAFETLRQVFGNRISQDRASMLREQEADSALGRLRKTLDIQEESDQGQRAKQIQELNIKNLQSDILSRERKQEDLSIMENFWRNFDPNNQEVSPDTYDSIRKIRANEDLGEPQKQKQINNLLFMDALAKNPDALAAFGRDQEFAPVIRDMLIGKEGTTSSADSMKLLKERYKLMAKQRERDWEIRQEELDKISDRQERNNAQKAFNQLNAIELKAELDELSKTIAENNVSGQDVTNFLKSIDYRFDKFHRDFKRSLDDGGWFGIGEGKAEELIEKLDDLAAKGDVAGYLRTINESTLNNRMEEWKAGRDEARENVGGRTEPAGSDGGSNPPPPPEAGNLDNPEKLNGSAIDTQNDIWIGSPPGSNDSWIYARTADKNWVRIKDANGNPLNKATLDAFIKSNEGKEYNGMTLTRDLIMKILKAQSGVK